MKRKLKLKRWHYYVIAAVVLLIALGVAGYIKREGIKYHVNSWRASGLLEDSIKSSKEEDWKEAERLAFAAWQLNEGNYETLKQLYLASQAQRSRYILVVSKMLFTHPEAKPEDRIDVLQLYLNLGDPVTFKALFAELESEEQMSPDAMALGVRFLQTRNDLSRALALVEELLKVRGNPADKLLAAEILSKIDDPSGKAQASAQRFIDELFRVETKPEIALSAYELLRLIPTEFWHLERFADADKRLQAISENHEVQPFTFLLAKEIEVHQFPENREIILQETTAEWIEKGPSALCEWLLRLGESKRILDLIEDNATSESSSLFRLVTLAAITEEQWGRAEKLLRNPHPQMRPSIVLGLQAAIAEKQGQAARSRSLWQQALSQAELASGQTALLEVAKLASRSGNAEVRNRAVTEALKRPSAISLPAADVAFLFEVLAENDEADDLLTVSRNLLASDRENPVLINNVVWLELIMETQREDCSELLRSLVEKFPDIPPLRSTLALSLMTNGKSEEALAMMTPTSSSATATRKSSSATHNAVTALAFARTGNLEQARSIHNQIQWSGMMEIEQAFFKKAFDEAFNPEPDESTLLPEN